MSLFGASPLMFQFRKLYKNDLKLDLARLIIIRVKWYNEKYQHSTASRYLPHHLIHLMQIYFRDGEQRIYELNHMRFMYEETPHYEQGYVMSEIIERYRKMVMHVKRPLQFHSDSIFDTLKRTELIQKLYFEIYHLVNMAHEIQRKYKGMPEIVSKGNETSDEYPDDKGGKERPKGDKGKIKDRKDKEKIAKKEGKKRDKFMKKIQEMLDRQRNRTANKKNYTKYWPLEYGWEIDYYW